jgi:hypothetical protein
VWTLLAEDASTGWLVALSTLAAAVIGALAAAVVKLWSARRQIRQEERRDAISEYREIIDRLEAQAERQAAVIRQQGQAVETMQRAWGDCREECAENTAAARFLYGLLKNLHQLVRSLGRDPGELPELPKSRRYEAPDPEFLARQARHSAELVEEAGQVLPKPPESNPPVKGPP